MENQHSNIQFNGFTRVAKAIQIINADKTNQDTMETSLSKLKTILETIKKDPRQTKPVDMTKHDNTSNSSKKIPDANVSTEKNPKKSTHKKKNMSDDEDDDVKKILTEGGKTQLKKKPSEKHAMKKSKH